MYAMMVVPSDFPNGDAGAVRDIAFAKMYQQLGYEVILVGAGKKDTCGSFQGVTFYSVYEEKKGIQGQLYRFIMYPQKYMAVIQSVINKKGSPGLIHINDIAARVIHRLHQYSVKRKIPMLHDSTEWYSPCEFKMGRLDKAYLLKDRLNKRVIQNPMKVIGISSYLTDHFSNRGLDALRIPVITDVVNTPTGKHGGSVIRLIYAGSPAGKDYVKESIQGFGLLTAEEQSKFEYHLYGIHRDQLKQLLGSDTLSEKIVAHGRVERTVVEQALLDSDFSVLLRPDRERYTKAGFPTKSVEAMAHGVAMLCNITSDLGLYLEHGSNAVVCSGYTPKDFARALRYTLTMDRERINTMKEKARETADRYFDYRLWAQSLGDFIRG